MNFGIGSFAYRWSIGRPYYRPEDPMTVDQLIDRCVKYGVKAVLLCNNISLHEFTEEQLTAIRDRIVKEGMTVETGSRGDVITGVPLGQGYVDFPLMLDILKQNGYDGNIFLELYINRCDTHAETVAYEEECVKQSMAYAHDTLGF